MRSSIISLSLAAIIGIVIGLLLQSPDSSTDSSPQRAQADNSTPSTMQPSNEGTQAPALDALTQQLQEEILARKTLQKEVATLSKKVASLATAKNNIPVTDETETVTHTGESAADSTGGNTWFDQQALIDVGMTKSEAEQLKTQFEKLELEKLYLRDQAIREGWTGGRRYREEFKKLEAKSDSIKQNLGEDAYDAYLFASKQQNRIAVQSVLSSSAADKAGMLSGDQVIRYNGERIYNGQDLRNATTQGDLTETVPIEILRDDKPMELYVQRGPLGIRMSSVSVAP